VTLGPTSAANITSDPIAAMVGGVRLMNYYPARHPWNGMWSDWQQSAIDADMATIAALGANTVRVIVQPGTFGYPTPQPAYASRLAKMLDLAASHGLKVQLTLFDIWTNYNDLNGSRQWANAILSPLYGDPRIAFVELQNEIQPKDTTAMSWARTMLPVIRNASGRPVTLSVSGWNTATPLAQLISALRNSQPDFYDLHFYGTPENMLATFQSAKQLAAGRPLLIGETGYSTDANNNSVPNIAATVAAHEQEQATFLSQAEQATRAAGLPPAAPWILQDFPALPNLSPNEQHFGLYRLDGTPKPAAAVIHAAFTSP
jgi:endo-1,4-beta-mannosidase